MSVLPSEAMGKLICSSCKKYLSVLNVKVYPNKTVKCNRCSSTNDGGTVSFLYEIVAKKVKFPCINRFEGCREMLDINNTKTHEETHCISEEVTCPLCSDDMDSTYDLVNHLKSNHESAALEIPAFWIDLGQWLHKETFFYCKDDVFVIVGYQYAGTNEQLTLYFKIYGRNNPVQKNMMHMFKLSSKEFSLETDPIQSVQSDLTDPGGLQIDLSQYGHSSNVFCVLKMWDATTTATQKKTNGNANFNVSIPTFDSTSSSIIDGAAKTALLKFKFTHLSELEENLLYFSDFKYWVGSRLWQLTIEKKVQGGTEPFLAVFLYQLDNQNERKGLCKIIANISLISWVDTDLNVNRSMTKGKFKITAGWKNFLNWHSLTDPKLGYIKDDFVQFEVCIDVLPLEDNEVSGDDGDGVKDCPNCH